MSEQPSDKAIDILIRFEQELEKQRLHFYNLQDPRATDIYYALVPIHEALKAAIESTKI